SYRRYGVEFHVAQFTMGSETSGAALNIGGTNYYLSLYPTFGPMVPGMTFHAYVRALDAPIAMQRAAGQTFIRDGVRSADHQVIAPGDGWVSMTIHHQVNPYESVGYQPDLFQFRCSASGHRYLLACLARVGGITDVDENVGVIASISSWLPCCTMTFTLRSSPRSFPAWSIRRGSAASCRRRYSRRGITVRYRSAVSPRR